LRGKVSGRTPATLLRLGGLLVVGFFESVAGIHKESASQVTPSNFARKSCCCPTRGLSCELAEVVGKSVPKGARAMLRRADSARVEMGVSEFERV